MSLIHKLQLVCLIFVFSFIFYNKSFAYYNGVYTFPSDAIEFHSSTTLANNAYVTMISSTTLSGTYTVLQTYIYTNDWLSGNFLSVKCGTSYFPYSAYRGLGTSPPTTPMPVLFNAPVLCKGDLLLYNKTGSIRSYTYSVVAVPATSTATSTAISVFTGVSYYDWLLVVSIIMFLISFVTIGYFWGIIKVDKNKYKL